VQQKLCEPSHASTSRDGRFSAPRRQQDLSEAEKHRLNSERKMTQLSSLIMRLKAVWTILWEKFMSCLCDWIRLAVNLRNLLLLGIDIFAGCAHELLNNNII
jgi:hypothetical protein